MADKYNNDGDEDNPYFGPRPFFENFENTMEEQEAQTGMLQIICMIHNSCNIVKVEK